VQPCCIHQMQACPLLLATAITLVASDVQLMYDSTRNRSQQQVRLAHKGSKATTANN